MRQPSLRKPHRVQQKREHALLSFNEDGAASVMHARRILIKKLILALLGTFLFRFVKRFLLNCCSGSLCHCFLAVNYLLVWSLSSSRGVKCALARPSLIDGKKQRLPLHCRANGGGLRSYQKGMMPVKMIRGIVLRCFGVKTKQRNGRFRLDLSRTSKNDGRKLFFA